MIRRNLLNIVILAAFGLVSLVVFAAAFFLPDFGFSAFGYAPVRVIAQETFANPVVISVYYSTEKEDWVEATIDDFYRTNPRVNGRPVEIEFATGGSREIYLDVLNGVVQPDVISPASTLQISLLENLSTAQNGVPIVHLNDDRYCREVVETPVVLVAWRERADVLWGAGPSEDLWREMHVALTNPEGWAAYNHPEWGFIKFGHTNPLSSNSGFMTILLMTYDYFGKTSGLTSGDILSDTGYQQWFLEIEGSITEFGNSTGTYMNDIIAYGPSQYDVVAVYEATAIGQADNAVGRYGELRVYYPPTTVMSDHPYCILDAAWVTPEKEEAAQLYIDFLLSDALQQTAYLDHGFRPVNPNVDLNQTGSPFQRYAANGLSITLPPEVEVPSGDVLNTLLDFWTRNVQP